MDNERIEEHLTPAQRDVLNRLDTPLKIQEYLNTIALQRGRDKPKPGTGHE